MVESPVKLTTADIIHDQKKVLLRDQKNIKLRYTLYSGKGHRQRDIFKVARSKVVRAEKNALA